MLSFFSQLYVTGILCQNSNLTIVSILSILQDHSSAIASEPIFNLKN